MSNLIYLDHHATTPVDPVVVHAMEACWRGERTADDALDVESFVGTPEGELRWTSGATEANALVLASVPVGAHVVMSSVEHASVVGARLPRGVEVSRVPVDGTGCVDPEAVQAALRPRTALVSVMHVNNEVGTVQPLVDIGAIARGAGVRFHVDAVQTPAHLSVEADRWHADYVVLSAHKLYGPKGVGWLWMRDPSSIIDPLLPEVRTSEVVRMGAALAVRQLHARREADAAQARRVRAALWDGLQASIPEVRINGPAFARRHPGNLHVSFSHVDAQLLLRAVHDRLAISRGSACASTGGPSHVLAAMGFSEPRISGSIRMAVGRGTSMEEVERAVGILRDAVAYLRARSSLWRRR